ncbi:cellulose binding domain-containing protein [Streptomyces prunicolor]|uniref:cellulose binding domain-containing protein n=1 Tax=Streptomyces prunicolor TaxID=67348 RepID=UPI0033F7DCAF
MTVTTTKALDTWRLAWSYRDGQQVTQMWDATVAQVRRALRPRYGEAVSGTAGAFTALPVRAVVLVAAAVALVFTAALLVAVLVLVALGLLALGLPAGNARGSARPELPFLGLHFGLVLRVFLRVLRLFGRRARADAGRCRAGGAAGPGGRGGGEGAGREGGRAVAGRRSLCLQEGDDVGQVLLRVALPGRLPGLFRQRLGDVAAERVQRPPGLVPRGGQLVAVCGGFGEFRLGRAVRRGRRRGDGPGPGQVLGGGAGRVPGQTEPARGVVGGVPGGLDGAVGRRGRDPGLVQCAFRPVPARRTPGG